MVTFSRPHSVPLIDVGWGDGYLVQLSCGGYVRLGMLTQNLHSNLVLRHPSLHKRLLAGWVCALVFALTLLAGVWAAFLPQLGLP